MKLSFSSVKNNFKSSSIQRFLLNNAIYIVLLVMIIVFVIIDSTFLSLTNFGFILTQASTRIILALGVGGIIVLGGADLSIGRMVGLTAVISASLLQSTTNPNRIFADMPVLPLLLPIILVVVIGGVFSVINGVVVTKLHVTPFVATMGMMLVIYGIASTYYESVGASPIGGLDKRFTDYAQGGLDLGFVTIPYLLIYAAAIIAIMWFIWNKTKLGRSMFAIGGNLEAADVSGVNITVNTILIYLIAGLLYGFAGSLEVARTGSATNNLGNGYEMDAIASCVVGGVSLMGGVGTIGGIVAGALIFQVINYGLVYIGVNPYMLYIIKGTIIVFAVAIDAQKYIKKK